MTVVRQYQTIAGLPVSGTIDEQTWMAPAGAAGATLESLSGLILDDCHGAGDAAYLARLESRNAQPHQLVGGQPRHAGPMKLLHVAWRDAVDRHRHEVVGGEAAIAEGGQLANVVGRNAVDRH